MSVDVFPIAWQLRSFAHMAFAGQGLATTVAALKRSKFPHDLRKLPAYGSWQLSFFDPNDAKIEIDFDPGEKGPD